MPMIDDKWVAWVDREESEEGYCYWDGAGATPVFFREGSEPESIKDLLRETGLVEVFD